MSWTTDDAYDAMERIERLQERRHDLILHCYLNDHGPVTREERQRFAELADEIAGLYGQLSDYYRQQAEDDRNRSRA